MSMTMPALQKAKQQLKTVICRSNLRQWGLVFEMFLDDNDRKFMSGYEWQNIMTQPSGTPAEGAIDNGGDHSWPLILQRHYKNQKLLRCPTAKKPPIDNSGQRVRTDSVFSTWLIWLYHPTDYYYGSYGINSWVYNRGGEVGRWRWVDVKRTDNIPVFLDCFWCEGYPYHYNEPPAWPVYGEFGDSSNHMKRFCLNRHSGYTNALFLDGCVRGVPLKRLWKLRWHRQWPMNAPGPVWPDWMKDMKE